MLANGGGREQLLEGQAVLRDVFKPTLPHEGDVARVGRRESP